MWPRMQICIAPCMPRVISTAPEPSGRIAMRRQPLTQRYWPIRCGHGTSPTYLPTYLPSPVRGKFYYLYLIEDIYSRKAVGWEVHEAESGEEAALLQTSVMH